MIGVVEKEICVRLFLHSIHFPRDSAVGHVWEGGDELQFRPPKDASPPQELEFRAASGKYFSRFSSVRILSLAPLLKLVL
jgi:hypothetical protein